MPIKTLAGYLMISGMNVFKELTTFASADRFLRRGFACLCIDGPGQGTSPVREIWYDPDTMGEVGAAVVNLLERQPEIDAKRIFAWGPDFASFWATQMAAAEPRFAACAVMYTCFQPGNWPLYEMDSPSFKQRFMYMTGVDDEQVDHLNNVPGPKTLVMYAGEEHGMGGSRSSQLGAPFFPIIADWLADRAAGKPLESTYTLVDRTGLAHTEPWGEHRSYRYGAPLGVEQLFSDQPPVGLS